MDTREYDALQRQIASGLSDITGLKHAIEGHLAELQIFKNSLEQLKENTRETNVILRSISRLLKHQCDLLENLLKVQTGNIELVDESEEIATHQGG